MLELQGSCGIVVTEREGFEPSVPLRNPRADGRLSRHARSAIRTL